MTRECLVNKSHGNRIGSGKKSYKRYSLYERVRRDDATRAIGMKEGGDGGKIELPFFVPVRPSAPSTFFVLRQRSGTQIRLWK